MSSSWVEILAENEEALLVALRQAYKEACGAPPYSGQKEVVVIDQGGEIRQTSRSSTTTFGDVYRGEAIEVGSIDWFDPWESADVEEVIRKALTPDELESYLALLTEENGEDALDFLGLASLERWNKEVSARVCKEFLEDFSEIYGPQWAEESFDSTFLEEKDRESWQKENI